MGLTYVVLSMNRGFRYGLIYVGNDFEQAMKERIEYGCYQSNLFVFIGNELVAEVSVSAESFKKIYG